MTLSHPIVHAAVRALLLTVLAIALQATAPIWGAADDSGLGTGLTAFAVIAAVALIWALVDGVREQWRALLVWGSAIVPTGLLLALALGLGTGLDAGRVLAEAPADTAFMAVLVGLPAALGATAGAAFAATLPTRRT